MQNSKKLCCIYHFAAHYRYNIFKHMEDELECHFIFGKPDYQKESFETLSPDDFRFFDFMPHNRVFLRLPFYWQSGVLKALFHGYTHFIVLGDPYCVTNWLLAILLRFMPDKKLYLWTHGWYGKETWFIGLIKKVFLHLADGILLYGNYAKKLMQKEGFQEKRLFVIHNSLDYEKQMSLCRNCVSNDIYVRHFDNDQPVLIFVGRLNPKKRLDMILSAMARLAEKKCFPNLVLVGDGPELPLLKRQVDEAGMTDRVWFFGACYEEEKLSELFYNATVCVAPGEVGLTAIHALTYGCPTITHNGFPWQMPEFEAIRPGITGDFSERGNVQSLADVLYRDLPRFRFAREEIRRACQAEIANEWTPSYQIKILKRALQ